MVGRNMATWILGLIIRDKNLYEYWFNSCPKCKTTVRGTHIRGLKYNFTCLCGNKFTESLDTKIALAALLEHE